MAETAKVWYLGHSGFAVRVSDTLLIFDYYNDRPEGNARSLESGVINPDEIKDFKVLVFSSHRHPDHFNPVIMSWKEKLPQAEYFLSSDIPKKYHTEWAHILKPYQTYETPDMKINTFKSTDEGVAFLVNLNGVTIYHAGDLNWWHWNEESKAWNNDMAARFKYEVSLMKDTHIGIAFLTADPRQEQAQLWGMIWFLEHVDVKTAFPMHFWDDYGIMGQIGKEALKYPVLEKVRPISARGEYFNVTL